MTVGEKIQHYRKKFNLSQEELGQKLLVSRQTVSLWEMDKTLPTVDNLIRLKEIFSVSLDEMLDTAEPAEETPAALKETYTFGFDTADMGDCAKKILAPATGCLVLTVLACVCLFVGFFLGKISESEGFWGSAAICLMSVCVCTAIYIYRIRVWKVNEKRFLQNEYSYAVYDDYFVVHIFRKGELVSTDKVYFYELEKAVHWPRHIVLRTSGRSYILKRCVLAPNSKFLDFCNSTSGGMVVQKPEGIRKIVSIALVVLSACTAWGAWGCFAALNGGGAVVVENMQVFYAFLPIPAASVLYGLYLKKKRYKYLKNIVVGIIMAAFLCIYGSFSFMFNTVSYDDSSVYKAEELLGIDIPPYTAIYTYDQTKSNQEDSAVYYYYISEVYFSESAVEEFERNLHKDSARWLPSIPADASGTLFSDIVTGKVLAKEYHLIYNVDTGEYGRLSNKSGTYKYLQITYHTQENMMEITEYDEEYIQ